MVRLIVKSTIMESRIERKRARLFRLIAWTISLTLHLALIYFVFGSPGLSQDVVEENVALVDDRT